MKKTKLIAVLAAIVGFSLCFAGCSGDDDNGGSGDNTGIVLPPSGGDADNPNPVTPPAGGNDISLADSVIVFSPDETPLMLNVSKDTLESKYKLDKSDYEIVTDDGDAIKLTESGLAKWNAATSDSNDETDSGSGTGTGSGSGSGGTSISNGKVTIVYPDGSTEKYPKEVIAQIKKVAELVSPADYTESPDGLTFTFTESGWKKAKPLIVS